MRATKKFEFVTDIENTEKALRGLSALRKEAINEEIKRQEGVYHGVDDMPSDKAEEARAACWLYLAKVAKDKAIEAYKEAECEFISVSAIGVQDKQTNVILGALWQFAKTLEQKEMQSFAFWVNDNCKAYTNKPIDTLDRLNAFIRDTYNDYILGREKARDKAAEKAAEKAESEKAAERLSAEMAEMMQELERLRAENEKLKKAKN